MTQFKRALLHYSSVLKKFKPFTWKERARSDFSSQSSTSQTNTSYLQSRGLTSNLSAENCSEGIQQTLRSYKWKRVLDYEGFRRGKNKGRFCHKLFDRLLHYVKSFIHFYVCLFFYCSRKDDYMLLHGI